MLYFHLFRAASVRSALGMQMAGRFVQANALPGRLIGDGGPGAEGRVRAETIPRVSVWVGVSTCTSWRIRPALCAPGDRRPGDRIVRRVGLIAGRGVFT